ncbi:hypothetical protein F5Y14DRAFT_414624 [Nemania sp. NC0429]|nr:hypothetical protein F5Y14DRAFT_414624 [Nemania sp. NC0429]
MCEHVLPNLRPPCSRVWLTLLLDLPFIILQLSAGTLDTCLTCRTRSPSRRRTSTWTSYTFCRWWCRPILSSPQTCH